MMHSILPRFSWALSHQRAVRYSGVSGGGGSNNNSLSAGVMLGAGVTGRLSSSFFVGNRRGFRTNTVVRDKYNRSKEHINVGTIGHVDHGKTTLTAAITKYLSAKGGAKYVPYEKIDKTPEEIKRGITISASHVEYETDKRHYAHIDCPGHQNYIKNMITGACQMDGGILVVSGPEGPKEQTREHLILSKEIGVPKLIVYMNKCDLVPDPDLLELVEEEVRDLLNTYGFDGNNTTVVKGSALLAVQEGPENETEVGRKSVERLIDAMDNLPLPLRENDKPFLMPIEDVFSISGRGTVATGRVEQGMVKLGEEVSVVGRKPIPKVAIIGIEMFKKEMESAQVGDNIGALLRSVKREDVMRGEVICKAGAIEAHTKFSSKVYITTTEEGGRPKPFGSNYKPQFFLRTANITGTINLGGEDKLAMPGDNLEMEVELLFPTPLEEGMRFAIREGSLTVGAGVVTKIHD